ncbi:MAG: hypothetical protein QOF48_3965 [Verrucomicrobiota bacterium]|jgi:hypothetical protein
MTAFIPPTYPLRPINGGPLNKALPKSGDWSYEPKYNGWRTLVHVPTGAMFNRKCERLSIESEFAPALRLLRATLDAEAFEWVDCEALERRHGIGRGTLIVLDVIPHENKYDYGQRRAWLTPGILPFLYPSCRPEDNALFQSARIDAKLADEYWRLLPTYNVHFGCGFFEGLVAKRTNSLYPKQLRSATEEYHLWMKHRWAF